MFLSRAYSVQKDPQDALSKMEAVGQRSLATLKSMTELGKQWGQNSMQTATATVNYWWERYEEFVGLNEVRDAQSKVTEVSLNKHFDCLFKVLIKDKGVKV